ncbi:pilin [Patescibacteria group bacterium]|nr:pilin [Patescibacteria group bacterium]
MKYNILFFIAFVCLLVPATSQAGEFVNLVGVPGIDSNGLPNLNAYINALYRLSISIAALLAVIKIVIAGAKYMLSDIVTHKEDAKKDIQGALIGLLIVIGAIIILNTINTDLTNLNLSVPEATVNQGPTIQEVLAARQRTLEDLEARAIAAESDVRVRECPFYDGAFGIDSASRDRCRQECVLSRGQFTPDLLFGSTCTYSEAEAISCDVNSGTICCEAVHGGSWSDGPPRACSGVTEGTANRRSACANEGRVWDTAGNYCRTTTIDVGAPVDTTDIIGTQVTPITAIESGLGLTTGEVGETELEAVSQYLSGSIDAEELEVLLGAPIPNIATLNTLSSQLSCGGGNAGDTVSYTRTGGNVTFTCVNAIP